VYKGILKYDEGLADKFMSYITELKDELAVKNTEKKLELEKKDIELLYKDKELLSSKGKLTARGIFEFYMYLCFGELQTGGICKQSEKFNVSNMLVKMGLKENQEKLPPGGYCASLLSAADQCNVELSSVYMVLCNDIHGSPWSGPGVLVYASELNVGQKCLVEFIADKMKLNTIEQ
jgi:hypothetical protein